MLATKVAVSAFILYWFTRYIINQLKPLYPTRHVVMILVAFLGVCSIFTFVGALIWATFSYDF